MSRLGTTRNIANRSSSLTGHHRHLVHGDLHPEAGGGGGGEDGTDDMKEALQIAADAHGIPTSLGNHEPLLSHQGCVCADTVLPVITLSSQGQGRDSHGVENEVCM